jgi:hypothetical protein
MRKKKRELKMRSDRKGREIIVLLFKKLVD